MVNTNFPRTPEEQAASQRGTSSGRPGTNPAHNRGVTPQGNDPQHRQTEPFSNTSNRGDYLGRNQGRLDKPDQTPGLTAMEDAYNNRMRASEAENEDDGTDEETSLSLPQEGQDNRQAEIAAKQAEFRAKLNEQNQYQEQLAEQQTIQAVEQNARQQMFKNRQAAEEKAKRGEERTGLDMTWFLIALMIAITLDILGFAISFIPAVGEGASSFIIMPIGMFIIWAIHLVNGVKFTKKSRLNFLSTAILEAIPFVNMLPVLTLCVLLSKAKPMIENQVEKFGGAVGGADGAKIVSTINKQINR